MRVEEKCDCGFQQTMFFSVVARLFNKKAKSAGIISQTQLLWNLDLCKMVLLRRESVSGGMRKKLFFFFGKALLILWRQVNCENLRHYEWMKWQRNIKVKKGFSASKNTENGLELSLNWKDFSLGRAISLRFGIHKLHILCTILRFKLTRLRQRCVKSKLENKRSRRE